MWRGRTLGRPSHNVYGLRVFGEGREILDFAFFAVGVDLPKLCRGQQRGSAPSRGPAPRVEDATYPNVRVSASSGQTPLAGGLEMGRVDGLALVVPIDDQGCCLHGAMRSVEGPERRCMDRRTV